MATLSDEERALLERLASEGKPTRLLSGDLQIAKSLSTDGLLFMVRDTGLAIVTPKGRHALGGIEIAARPAKKPFGFMD